MVNFTFFSMVPRLSFRWFWQKQNRRMSFSYSFFFVLKIFKNLLFAKISRRKIRLFYLAKINTRKYWYAWGIIHKNIFVCQFSIHNIITLSRHEQVCLMRLRLEKHFSHHRAYDGRSISRNIISSNILVHDLINVINFRAKF